MAEKDNKDSDRDEGISSEEESTRHFLLWSFPYIFENAILKAKNDVERQQLAEQFGGGPVVDFESLKKLLGYVAYIEREEKREKDSQVLFKYANIAMKVFLQARTQKVKNGLSIQYLFNGEVIASIGHALSEGFTEWTTQKSTPKIVEKLKEMDLFNEVAKHSLGNKNGTYLLEVKFADRLVNLVGEQLLGKAYFGDVDDLENLARAVDEKLGEGTFMRLLQLSDDGNWREVFWLLKS